MNRHTPTLGLRFHHSTPPRVACSLTARVEVCDDGGLRVDYRLRGNPASLLIPPAAPARQADFLWQHTCFEAFVAVEGEAAYREFNFSPSGEWAMYAFAGYRTPAERPVVASDPAIVSGWTQGEFRLMARIAPADLPVRSDGRAFKMGLCAVIEEADRRLSYWAFRHHPCKPDFHGHDGLALRLSAAILEPTATFEMTT